MARPVNHIDANENIDSELEAVVNSIIDDLSLGVCFDVHRALKMGYLFLDDDDPESKAQFAIVEEKGLDVFGQGRTKKQVDCECPNCSRNIAASRFAPHLEKCMGMGRNSSRIANRRIAMSQRKNDGSEDEDEDSNSKDELWDSPTQSKKAILKSSRSGCLLKKLLKSSTSGSSVWDVQPRPPSEPSSSAMAAALPLTYDHLPIDERKSLLSQFCGVISEHTKKICAKSLRCPQHSDQQRKSIRQSCLRVSECSGEEIHVVDIDSYSELDGVSLKDALQWEVASSPSPSDSTSTTRSTGSASLKRKHIRKKPIVPKKKRN